MEQKDHQEFLKFLKEAPAGTAGLITKASTVLNTSSSKLTRRIIESINAGTELDDWLSYMKEKVKMENEKQEKRRMIVYLSGPISNKMDTYQKYFYDVYTRLKRAGHSVISPHFLPPDLDRYQDYMNIAHECVKAAEGILLLNGWEDSKGSKMELKWAMDMGKKIYIESDRDSISQLLSVEELE